MNKQQEISTLLEELKELFTNTGNAPHTELDEQKLILSKSYALQLSIADKSKSLIELTDGSIYSHHSIYENKLIEPIVQAGQKIYSAPWITITHPDDIAFILKLFKATIQFLHLLPQKQVNKFSLAYLHRIMNIQGEYECFIVNCRVVLNEITHRPQLLLLHFKICPDIEFINGNRYRLIHITPVNLFKKSKLIPKSEYVTFTNREQVILYEVNNGKLCKEIATELHLSETTITKHWRNISIKTGVKYIKQASMYVVHLGIFQLLMLLFAFCVDDVCFIV